MQFDRGGSEAALRHFEVLSNRHVFYYLIKEVGLEAYADEWWHYNAPQTQMGAKIGKDTVFPKAAIIKPPEK